MTKNMTKKDRDATIAAMYFCEKRHWEYRRGYIFYGWEWEVIPCLYGDFREDLRGVDKILQRAVDRAKQNVEKEKLLDKKTRKKIWG